MRTHAALTVPLVAAAVLVNAGCVPSPDPAATVTATVTATMTATATATVTATATTTAKVTADPAEPTDTALESLMEQSDTLESILNISTVDDLDQLVGVWEAFTGEVCLHDQTGQVELSTESTVCGPGTVLSTYEDFSDLKARVDESDEALLGRGLSEQWLVGDNWIINSNETDLEKLSELISGHVITLGN